MSGPEDLDSSKAEHKTKIGYRLGIVDHAQTYKATSYATRWRGIGRS